MFGRVIFTLPRRNSVNHAVNAEMVNEMSAIEVVRKSLILNTFFFLH
jgi:hypothetical protein